MKERQKLKPFDLEEVDRLVALAGTCVAPTDVMGCFGKLSNIRNNALLRAAEILGVEPDEDKVAESAGKALSNSISRPASDVGASSSAGGQSDE